MRLGSSWNETFSWVVRCVILSLWACQFTHSTMWFSVPVTSVAVASATTWTSKGWHWTHDIFNTHVFQEQLHCQPSSFWSSFYFSSPTLQFLKMYYHIQSFQSFTLLLFSEMEMPAQRSLQSFFVRFIIIQHYVQQLNVIEESIIDLMDLFEDEAMPHVQPLLTQVRAEVRQIRFHLDWLSSIKLLQAARLLQLHVQLYGRLPHLDM